NIPRREMPTRRIGAKLAARLPDARRMVAAAWARRPSAKTVAGLQAARKLRKYLLACRAFVPNPRPHGRWERGNQMRPQGRRGESPQVWRSATDASPTANPVGAKHRRKDVYPCRDPSVTLRSSTPGSLRSS